MTEEEKRAKRAAYMREYYRRNPEARAKAAARKRQLRQEKHEIILAQEKASRDKHRDKKRERDSRYKRENKDKVNAAARVYARRNPEKISLWAKRKRQKHGAMYSAANAKRRALKANAMPAWVNSGEIREIYAERRRISEETGVNYHVDHIIPLNHEMVCGLHVPWNLQIIPARENLEKTNSWRPA